MHLPAPGASNLVIALDGMLDKLDKEYVQRYGFRPSGLRKRLIQYNDECMAKKKRWVEEPSINPNVRGRIDETIASYDPRKTINDVKEDVRREMEELNERIENEEARLTEILSNIRPFDGLEPEEDKPAPSSWGEWGIEALKRASGTS